MFTEQTPSGHAPSTFRVIRMDSSPFECRNCVFDEAGLVQGVRVNVDLNVVLVRHGKTRINGSWRSAPVLRTTENNQQ